jgi:uncharacterized repeat protein (TIGR01451 family)
MRKIYAFIVAFFATTAFLHSQSYYYDAFDYPVGNLGHSSGPVSPAVNPATSTTTTNWNFGSTRSAKVLAGSLTYPGLLTSATSPNMINLVNTGTAANIRMVITTTPYTTPVYFSFLMRVNAAPGSSTRVASFRGTTNNTSNTFAPRINIAPGSSSGYYTFRIDGGTNTPYTDSNDMPVNNIVLVVAKHTPSNDNGGGITDVWINPSAASLGAGSAPTPTIANVTGGVISNIEGFTFATGATSSVNADIDELRIGATWADVTPSGGEPVDLAISKTMDNSTPTVGSTVNFTLTASNSGYNTAAGVTVTDILPSGYTLVSATPSVGMWTAPTWTVGNLASAASATLSIAATVNGAGVYENKAYVTKDASDSKQTNDTATVAPTYVIKTLPLYEPFNQSEREFGGANAGVWRTAATRANVVAGSLSYSGLWVAPDTKSISYGGVASETIGSQRLYFNQQNSGTVYASSIIKVTSLPTADTYTYRYNFGFFNANNQFGGCVNLFPDQDDPDNKFFIGISKVNRNSYADLAAPYTTPHPDIIWSSTSYSINTPLLLVMGYDLTTEGEVMNLWINPAEGTLGAETAPAATLSDAATASTFTNGKNISGFLFRTGLSAPGIILDEVRIGTNWAGVTPNQPATFSTAGSGSGVWGNPSIWTGNVVPFSGAKVFVNNNLTIDQDVTPHSIEVSPGAKLTLNNGNALTTSTFTLASDAANGTGTFVDLNASSGVASTTTNIEQYFSSGRNWYFASPISNATSQVIKGTTSNQLWQRNVLGNTWTEIMNNDSTLIPGRGYIAKVAGSGVIVFNGALNNGVVSYPVKSQNVTSGKFHLVGNPYPSYLNWQSVAANNTGILPTIWLRTRTVEQLIGNPPVPTVNWTFATVQYDAVENELDIINGSANTTISGLIPPMQAFWVRIKDNVENTSFTVNNQMRHHADVANNKFKAPASTQTQRIRLEVSNGSFSDETLLKFSPNASDNFDVYDSPKMFNNIAAIPEIYTRMGNEKLAINGMNQSFPGLQMPLGFVTGQSNSFTIRASQIQNFSADMHVVLKDKQLNTEFDLTAGEAYSFTSDATNTEDRFVVMFKSASGTTAVDNALAGNMFVSSANGKLMLQLNTEISDARVTVYNATGQSIHSQAVVSPTTTLNKTLDAGVYLVKVVNGGRTVVLRTIVN